MLTPWTGIPSPRCSPFCSKQKLCPWCAWHRYRSVLPGAGQTTITTGVKKGEEGAAPSYPPSLLIANAQPKLDCVLTGEVFVSGFGSLGRGPPPPRLAGRRSCRPQLDAEWRRMKRNPDILLLACITCTELRPGGAIIGGNIIYRRLQGH